MSTHDATTPLLGHHPSPTSRYQAARRTARRGVDSHFTHLAVVFLVVADLVIIFAEFLLQLFRCEHQCAGGVVDPASNAALVQSALGVVSLIFSCVFMFELVVSLWAFGFEYFHSMFRVFDGTVIVVGFVLDVALKGVLEEVGTVVIILRLWRVFKVIGELSAQAAEQVGDLNEKIDQLKVENSELKREVQKLKGT